jgi:hypothetical protein
VKVVAKAKLENSSDYAQLAAGPRLVEAANVSKEHIGTRGHKREHAPVSERGSTRSARAGGAVEARSTGTRLDNQGRPDGSANAASPPRVAVQAEKVFDNLSKSLAGHAAQLPTEEQTKEQEIRKPLVESLKHFEEDRTALAGNLLAYKQVFKTQRQWTRVVTEIGAAIQVSARTVFRLIEDFERSQAGEVSDIMIDLSPIQGVPLDKEDRPFIRARLAIRSFLDEVPNSRKPQALSALLAEEAYQIWGARNPFLVEVSPKPSRFMIDGRKRIASASKEEGKEK